jgi:hypothetical protein
MSNAPHQALARWATDSGHSGFLCYSIYPIIWCSMLMRYSDDENMILFNRIKDFMGEFMNKIFPYFSCF